MALHVISRRRIEPLEDGGVLDSRKTPYLRSQPLPLAVRLLKRHIEIFRVSTGLSN